MFKGSPIYTNPNPEYLRQGDIIIGLPNFPFTDSDGLLILNYDCDIKNEKNMWYNCSAIYKMKNFIKVLTKYYYDENPRKATSSAVTSVNNKLYKITNYSDARNFFLPPNDFFSNSAVSVLEQLTSIPKSKEKTLKGYRKLSILSPWKEKLGLRTGDLFNRVGTDTPERDEVDTWFRDNFQKVVEKCFEELKKKKKKGKI